MNTQIENLKAAVVKMIKAGQPVFFGCDVGQFSDKTAGIMDTALYEYEVRAGFFSALARCMANPIPFRRLSIFCLVFRRLTVYVPTSRP